MTTNTARTAGGMQTITAQFNGGPLGGNANFQRYTTELRAYAPIGQLGGGNRLARPDEGLFVGPMTWREMHDLELGTVLLVLASERFDEADYIRDYDTFRRELAAP